MAYGDDAVTREVDYLNGITAVTGAIGPVRYGRPRSMPTTRVAWLRREQIAEVRVTTGRVQQIHDMLLTVRWPFHVANVSSGMLGSEGAQRGLDQAVAVALDAIRGPVHDSTHNSAFASVPDDMETSSIIVMFSEEWDESGSEYQEVMVRYRAVDHQTTG